MDPAVVSNEFQINESLGIISIIPFLFPLFTSYSPIV